MMPHYDCCARLASLCRDTVDACERFMDTDRYSSTWKLRLDIARMTVERLREAVMVDNGELAPPAQQCTDIYSPPDMRGFYRCTLAVHSAQTSHEYVDERGQLRARWSAWQQQPQPGTTGG